MKIEGGGGGRKSRKESTGKLLSRFLNDENSEKPPEPSDALDSAARTAALAATLALVPPTAPGSHAEAAPIERTVEQIALDRLIAGVTKGDRQQLNQMIEMIAHSPIDAFDERFFSQDELKCLTDNVYHEARSEPLQGRYAVIFATLSRVLDSRYPKTICGVVHQPWQFSWTGDQKILAQKINPRDYLKIAIEVNRIMKDGSLNSAAAVARMRSGLPHGAIFYKREGFTGSPQVQRFFAKLEHVATIGVHEFYAERKEETAEPKKGPQVIKTSLSPADEPPLPRPRAGRIRGS